MDRLLSIPSRGVCFHPKDPPVGMRNFDMGTLNKRQKKNLNARRFATANENELYFLKHPEIRAFILILLKYVLCERPFERVHETIGAFFNRPRELILVDLLRCISRDLWAAVTSVGWYVLAILVACWFASPYLREKYINWKLKKDERDYAAKYRKNPGLLQERLLGVESARQRMQQEYYEKCRQTAREEGEGEEGERSTSRKIDAEHTDSTAIDKDASNSTETKRGLKRRGYKPLIGDHSVRYRPPKRSSCSKGTCG